MVDHAWKTSDHTPIVRIQHGYDRGGNRLYRKDLVAEAHSELYQYDQMNQLVKLERGALNSNNTAIVSSTFEEDFTYDITGNWLNYKQDTTGTGTWDINQTRTHNAANEILTISGGNTLVAHDRNRCMTKIPKPLDNTSSYTLVYDAWNRLISVSDGDTLVVTYMYDARNHRIKKTVNDTVTLSYFNQNWQEVESVTAGVTTTYVYGLRYIDDIICRTTGSETVYALQDANWNVVALVNTSSTVAERLTYDSFGRVTFRNASFVAKTASSYNWTKTFTGQVYDFETGLMLYRNRYYHPGLGRFITRDPIGYDANDVNLYRYVSNGSIDHVDTKGLIDDMSLENRHNQCPSPMPEPGDVITLPNSIWANLNFPFTCSETRKSLSDRAGGDLRGAHKPKGVDSSSAAMGTLKVGHINDGKYIGSGGAETCVIVAAYCPNTGNVYAYHLAAGVNAGTALKNHRGCNAVVCGGNQERGSRCLLEDTIDTLNSQGVTLQGLIRSSGCYIGPDKKWYAEVEGVSVVGK